MFQAAEPKVKWLLSQVYTSHKSVIPDKQRDYLKPDNLSVDIINFG